MFESHHDDARDPRSDIDLVLGLAMRVPERFQGKHLETASLLQAHMDDRQRALFTMLWGFYQNRRQTNAACALQEEPALRTASVKSSAVSEVRGEDAGEQPVIEGQPAEVAGRRLELVA